MNNFFKKINIRSQKGLSIVELLLYMGILSILLSVLTSIFVSALDVQSESNAVSSVEQDGNYILARLSYDVRRAESISIPASGGLPPTDNFGIAIEGESYAYTVDINGNLLLTNNLGTNTLNNYGSSVSSFAVERFGNPGGVEDTLKISFTITGRTIRVSGVEAKDFETTLALRRQ